MIKKSTYGLFLSVLLFGCKPASEEADTRQKVVKVYSHVLYEEDVIKQIPFGTSYEDSISIRNSYLNSWIDSKLLLHQAELNLPLEEQDVTEKLLKNNKLIELFDNGYFYLVRIVDYKLKDGVSPLALEKENIKRIILNNRKLEFLQSLSSDIYENAKNQKEIELFIP